jgi:hypothetical protein|tara:strand:- start:584 stop:796 length:213 start_codon:yes stop_codon:yes gene_type:complete
VRDERTTRTFAAAGGAAGGGGADVQARSLDARVAFEDVYRTNERKIQSFFVIFKFIKIQKRKKKRRGKKE